jgi:hypothetical protein
MKLLKLLALSSLVLFLAACTPAISGTDASRPIESSFGDFSIRKGETQFVSVEYFASRLNFSRTQIDAIAPINFDDANALNQVRSIEGDISWLRQKSATLPKNWVAELVRSKIVRRTTKTEDTGNYTGGDGIRRVYFRDYVVLTFKVTAPAEEIPGVYTISVDVVGNSGVSGVVNLAGKIANLTNKA